MNNETATDARSLALNHVEAVKACNAAIEEALEQPKPDHRLVSALNAKLGVALKLAQVYACLAVADATAGRPRLLAGGGVDYSVDEVPC